MRIWVDADACPREVKRIVFRASERLALRVILVANSESRTPASDLIESVLVGEGGDMADKYIAARVEPGDVVITADVPLAAEVVSSAAVGIDPRGWLYDEETVGERLSARNFMQTLRAADLTQGGPPAFSETDKRRFADTLDRTLTRLLRG